VEGRQLVVTAGEGSLHEQGEQEPEGLLDGLVVGAGAVLAEVEQVAQQGAERIVVGQCSHQRPLGGIGQLRQLPDQLALVNTT
jgi:hypothetical protein